MNRILVIRGGAIGDFVLTLPAIKLLRDHFPEAHLEILGYKHIAALAENRFYARAVRSIEDASLARFFARDVELPLQWRDYFDRFELIVSYLFDPDLIFEQNIRGCGAKRFLACSPQITGNEPAVRQLARPLEQLGLSLGEMAPRLYPSAADREFARRFLLNCDQPMVAIHPGSGGEPKNWPIENWLEILEWLLESKRAASLLILGGEADEKQLTRLRASLPKAAVHFAENLPLPHVAAVLQKCALFLGHDSGISHIAAAVGARCVLLFGPSDPAVWAPPSNNVRVIRTNSGTISDLLAGEVKAAIKAARILGTTN